MGACNGILKGIFGNEKKSGQRRFKRSGRGWSIGKGLNKITGFQTKYFLVKFMFLF